MRARRSADADPHPSAVSARPVRTARIANACAAIVVIVFVVVAVLMRRDNAGAHFGHLDQVFTVILGLIIGAGLRIPTRPRLRADLDGVYLRSYLGDYRTIPWAAVVAVEFPRKNRFARLRLPADETLAIYAVQRMDRDDAVRAMQGLRALFAMTHGAQPVPPGAEP